MVFGFGTPASTAGTGAGGFSFGAKPATPAFGLGASPSGGGLSFGTPATSTPSFGTNFGAATTQAPTFGAPTAQAPAFGSSFGTPASAAPAFGTTFGTPASAAPGFGVATSAAPTFGVPTASAPSFGTSFGAPATTSTLGAGTGFNFGAATTSAAPTGLNFGAPAAAPATGLNFGGGTAAAPGLGGIGFGGGGLTSSAAPPNFSFGAGLNTTTTTTNAGFGLGTSTGAGGLFGKPAATLGGDANKPAAASVGLGGVDQSLGVVGGASGGQAGGGPAGNAPPKAAALPAELCTAVDAFKEQVRRRKQISSDIARHSIRPLHKVQSEAEAMISEVSELSGSLQGRRRGAAELRSRAAAAVTVAERAHRMQETPHGADYESEEAMQWLSGVVMEGEARLKLLQKQLEAAQRQLEAPVKPITDQELNLGMKRIHESFIAVAGRLQAVNTLLESQKTQYLALRRHVLKDPTDVFKDSNSSVSKADFSIGLSGSMNAGHRTSSALVSDPLVALTSGGSQVSRNTTGPSPFTYLGPPGFSGLPFGFKQQQPTTPANNTLGTTSWGLNSSLVPGGGSMSSSSVQSSLAGLASLTAGGQADPLGFSLQKPPAGNKRGKH